MSDELLPYYNRELAFIRHMGAEFAKAKPKIAGRLQLGPDSAEDPHVERLIEAFAYLNARTRHKLEDDYPELTDALLGILYPHYLAPIPSMAIVQFVLDRGQGDLTTGYMIARESAVESDPIGGEPCRFETSYPTTLWPIEVVSADLLGQPFTAPTTGFAADASAVLRLKLKCFAPDMTFAQLEMDSLRFYLKGQSQHVYAMYELLLNNAIGIALADSAGDREPVVLPAEVIQPVGFGRDEGMLPYSARSFLGYRLLTEYFAFPRKFLFFDLLWGNREALRQAGNEIEIYVYVNRSTVDLEQNVTADMFQLGCTPMVNLFRHRAEPIALTHTQTEYRVVPDARRPKSNEIYSIDRVTATSPNNERVEYRPFYSFKHGSSQDQKTFWHLSRRPAGHTGGEVDYGTEVYLTLTDLNFSPSVAADWTLDVETTCLNRDLPHRLPLGEGQGGLRLTKGAPVSRIECLGGRPTRALRPALKHGATWRLISHLSLNHLSLVDYEASADGPSADALREILKLYDFADSEETRSMIDGILSVRSKRVVGRVGEGADGAFCRGLEVTAHFDEEQFTGSGLYLFAAVLERFFGLYCSINSFSKFVATTNQREAPLRRWPPRAAERVLL